MSLMLDVISLLTLCKTINLLININTFMLMKRIWLKLKLYTAYYSSIIKMSLLWEINISNVIKIIN